LKVVEISRTKRKASRTLTAMGLRMLGAEVGIVLMATVRMAGIVEGAAGGRAAVGEIVDAAGVVDGLVAAGGIAGAAGLAGGDTRIFCQEFSRIYTDRR
jgi:hypothetical protein